MNRVLYPWLDRFMCLLIGSDEREICTDRFFHFTKVSVCIAKKQRRTDQKAVEKKRLCTKQIILFTESVKSGIRINLNILPVKVQRTAQFFIQYIRTLAFQSVTSHFTELHILSNSLLVAHGTTRLSVAC